MWLPHLAAWGPPAVHPFWPLSLLAPAPHHTLTLTWLHSRWGVPPPGGGAPESGFIATLTVSQTTMCPQGGDNEPGVPASGALGLPNETRETRFSWEAPGGVR